MKRIVVWLMTWILILNVSGITADVWQTLQQPVSISFSNTSVRDVLNMLAEQYNLNLVISGKVQGRLSLRLKNVTLREALDGILKPLGAHFVVQQNVILVKPLSQHTDADLQSRIFRLHYVDGNLLLSTLKPLLSDRGKIEILLSEPAADANEKRASIILVTDYWERLQTIEKVVQDLDQPIPQVQIEARLIETSLGTDKTLGIKWPVQVQVKATGAENSLPYQQAEQTASQAQVELSGWYKIPEKVGQLHLGVLTFQQLQATLSALAQDNHARLVSSPTVTTLNNHKAVIKIGTSVPVPQLSRGISGDVITYEEKEVNMYLEVVPRIGKNGELTLKVHPILEEIIGYAGSSDFPQPIISRREVETSVEVKDSMTVVLGGLIKENTVETVDKVWLLGDIPLLKFFFRHKKQTRQKTNLLIFLTPKIIPAWTSVNLGKSNGMDSQVH